LQCELAELMQNFKAKAASAKEPDDLWDIEEFLTQSRHAIDKKYDYRYSQLLIVFGILAREGRISMNDLAGLAEGKIQFIERVAAV
jgi:hypothetical protein